MRDLRRPDLPAFLRPFQREGVLYLSARRKALLADDCGLGKTCTALAARYVLGQANGGTLPGCLIVGPAVAKGVWQSECQKFFPDWQMERLDGLGSFRWPQPGELLVTNYALMRSQPCPRCQGRKQADEGWDCRCCKGKGLVPFAPKGAPEGMILILDEAHRARGGKKSQQASGVRRLSAAVRARGGAVWLLTATPLVNRPTDLWSVLQAAGAAQDVFGDYETFFRVCGGRRGFWGSEWGKPLPEAAAMLGAFMLRRRKSEVLQDLPGKEVQEILVENLPASCRAACDALQATLAERGLTLEDLLDIAERQERFPSDQKIPFELASIVRRELAEAKVGALVQLIEEYEAAGEPVVVFSSHRLPIDVLGKGSGWAAVTGSTPPAQRTELVAKFQAGELRGIAGTIPALGVAVTLTRASHVIFVDQAWNPADNHQAAERLNRIGQDRKVLVRILVADHPIDRGIARILRAKQRRVDVIVEGRR